jgi:hypothetical protein
MRTDDLIRALAADRPATAPTPSRMLVIAAAAGFAVSAIAFAAALGTRDDVAQAATSARFLFKPSLMVALAAIAGLQLRRLIRPGDPARLLWLALIPAALAGAVTAELATLPQSQWLGALVGHNWYKCISLIPLLSLPVIAALLWALRYGAPTHPGIAGAVAGMTASGLAGALYAINCTDDSPLFVAAWYSVAVVTVSLVGAVAGRKLLRW